MLDTIETDDGEWLINPDHVYAYKIAEVANEGKPVYWQVEARMPDGLIIVVDKANTKEEAKNRLRVRFVDIRLRQGVSKSRPA